LVHARFHYTHQPFLLLRQAPANHRVHQVSGSEVQQESRSRALLRREEDFSCGIYSLRDVENIVDAFFQDFGGNSTLNAVFSTAEMTLKGPEYN